MVAKSRMTEKQATKAYFTNKITKAEYHQVLRRISQSRYNKAVSKKKHRSSMSSSKWM